VGYELVFFDGRFRLSFVQAFLRGFRKIWVFFVRDRRFYFPNVSRGYPDGLSFSFDELCSLFTSVNEYFEFADMRVVGACAGADLKRDSEFVLVRISKMMHTDDIFDLIFFEGLRPATFEELVDYSSRNSLDTVTIALGSMCYMRGIFQDVAVVYSSSYGRVLSMLSMYRVWGIDVSFLAVKR